MKIIFFICFVFFIVNNNVFAYCNEEVAYIVIDANSGKILEQNKDKLLKHPASLTKIMTLYLTFEALKNNKISLDTEIEVSNRVANQPRFNADLKEREKITVYDAILGIIVKSFNDFAVALSEVVADNEWEFVRKMNKKAVELELENTYFKNSAGFSDDNQQTTAYDLAKLVFRIKKDFPEYYQLFSIKNFIFRDKFYESHNHLLFKYKYANGLKTGFTKKAGYNLATTAKKDEKELIGIVISCSNLEDRDLLMISILNNHLKDNIYLTNNKNNF